MNKKVRLRMKPFCDIVICVLGKRSNMSQRKDMLLNKLQRFVLCAMRKYKFETYNYSLISIVYIYNNITHITQYRISIYNTVSYSVLGRIFEPNTDLTQHDTEIKVGSFWGFVATGLGTPRKCENFTHIGGGFGSA